MRIGYADPSYFGCAYGMAIRWAGIYRTQVTDTDFDLDDEPVLTAEGEVAAAIWGHLTVCALDYANSDKVRTAQLAGGWPRLLAAHCNGTVKRAPPCTAR